MRRTSQVALTLLVSAVALWGQQLEPLLRVRFEPSDRVLVGQPLRLEVELLTPSWFPKPPRFPTLEIPHAITVMPEESALNLTTSIDGNSYSGLSRSYLIYPQATGEFTLPPAEITVVYALPNAQPSEPIQMALPPETFEAYLPAEAADMRPFLATTRLSVTQDLSSDPITLSVGDSFQRTITMEAAQTLAIFLPPVDWSVPDGIRVYPDPPQSIDRTVNRQGFVGGEKIESASYVAEEVGTYTLPAIEISWWDLSSSRVRTETLPAIEIEVNASQRAAIETFDRTEAAPEVEGSEPQTKTGRPVGLYTAALGLTIVTIWLLWSWLRNHDREPTLKQVEADLFLKFKRACSANDPAAAMAAAIAWLDHARHGQVSTLEILAESHGTEELRKQVEDLNHRLYARAGQGHNGWDGLAFYHSLATVRRQGTADDVPNKLAALPMLNP